MARKIYFCILFLILLVSGCVSDFNAVLPSADSDIVVIEGNIIANENSKFYLSKSFSLNASTAPKDTKNIVANLVIIGSDGSQSKKADYLGEGIYQIAVGELNENVSYGLRIEYNNDVYQSELLPPLHTPEIDSISWEQPEKGGDVTFYVSTHDNKSQVNYYTWNYVEDWEMTATYYTTGFYIPDSVGNGGLFYSDYSAPFYYCWKNYANKKILIGTTESLMENRIINKQLYQQNASSSDRFSVLYSVLITQRAITKSTYEYYQNKMILNEQMGGLFTPQPSELPGNVTCKTDPSKRTIGYISVAKNEVQKRIYVSQKEITRTISDPCKLFTLDEIQGDPKIPINELYESWYRPAGDLGFEDSPALWSFANCTDCVAAGGSKNKPSFWPNNHK